MAKFKIGDTVRILDGSTISNYVGAWAGGMRSLIGKIGTICRIELRGERTGYYIEDSAYVLDERGLELVCSGSAYRDIKDVIFNDPATIVMWLDGSKTVVKCQPGDTYSEELGLAMCIAKKYYGNTGEYNEVFKRFIPKESDEISVEDMRSKLREHCSARGCYECELSGPVCKCGRGKTLIPRFDTPKEFLLTDDEIRDAYARVFGKKEG